MEYHQVRQLIEEVSKYGSVMGLDSIRALMGRLDFPERALKVVHVAGTNGKGSTCAFLSSMLVECGFKVGKFSTPDVFCYEEKFQINGENISRESLCLYYGKIEALCQQMVLDGKPHPTLFEMETAIAVCYAADEKCDFLLLEAGMGGRTDATNYVRRPFLSVLTSISMDHMEYLGTTLEEIAGMKAGILKEGCPAVSTWQEKAAEDVIRREAEKLHCPICFVPKGEYLDAESHDLQGLSFFWRGKKMEISTAALYQVQNALTALQAMEMIRERETGCPERMAGENIWGRETGYSERMTDERIRERETGCPERMGGEKIRERETGCPERITDEKIRQGLKKARIPGRFMRVMYRRGESGGILTERRPELAESYMVSAESYRELAESNQAAGVEMESAGLFWPEIYLDGAHNPGAVRELVATLQAEFADYQKVFVFGVFRDKDYKEMLRILSAVEAKIITVTPPTERALEAECLAQEAAAYFQDVYCAGDYQEAAQKALEYAGAAGRADAGEENHTNAEEPGCADAGGKTDRKKSMVLIFGSFSYLNEMYEVLRRLPGGADK